MLKELKENYKELILIVVIIAATIPFILMISERVVPWNDYPTNINMPIYPIGKF